jgi:hypothetical protein
MGGLLILVIGVFWFGSKLIPNRRIKEVMSIGSIGACLVYFIINKAPLWLIIGSFIFLTVGPFILFSPGKEQNKKNLSDQKPKESK